VNQDSIERREPARPPAPVGEARAEPAAEAIAEEEDELAEDGLVMATARRIIESDAAIIHRLGTV